MGNPRRILTLLSSYCSQLLRQAVPGLPPVRRSTLFTN
jgi:hypothetical protein